MAGCTRYAFTITCLISLIIGNPAFGGEIFHWVDEDGVRHFSEWAPENSNAEVSKLIVRNSNPPGYDPNEDQNSILVQAERMNIRWAELKERQAERRKQRLELAEQERRQPPSPYDYDYFNVSRSYYRPIHPHRFSHHRALKIQKHQLVVLDQLGLRGGRRPHSINSSAHLARINAGKAFTQNIQPQHPGKAHHASTFVDW